MLDTTIKVVSITNIKYKDEDAQSVRFVPESPVLPTSTIIINQSKVKFEQGKKYTLTIAEADG